MPRDDATYKRVVGEYTARGFPGCIGSIDCVHIGWDRCPTQYTNVYTGDETYPIWSFLLPIQLSKSGHPPFFVRCRIPNWVHTQIGVSTLLLHPKWVQMHNLSADERFVRFLRQIGPALS
jgi:hypothetical protein